MDIHALLTSAGINIGLCAGLLSLYSILRKQPSFVSVYFGRRLAKVQSERHHFSFERFVPSPSWIVKAWETPEVEISAAGGLDAVVFVRMVIFSIRIFSITAIICIFLVLPLNYFGTERQHDFISSESLDAFTIGNIKEGSRWLWVHCVALYVISCCACVLLYFEYKSITEMRLAQFTGSPPIPSQFTVLVRAIPFISKESYSDTLTKFFTTYYGSSYLSHQMVYKFGTFPKLMSDAEKMYRTIKSTPMEQHHGSGSMRCGLCGGNSNSYKIVSREPESLDGRGEFGDSNLREKECAAALVFFRTRYAALVASEALLSTNPMLWVTDLAPEPRDIYWTNLFVSYRLLWIRRTVTTLSFIAFMVFFLGPVTFTQGLVHLDKLQARFPFMRGILKRKFVTQLVTGYLPSVILMLFLYIVPPMMILFSTVEGSISRSHRKKSTCIKVVVFLIWNVFFANVLSGTVIDRYMDRLSEMPSVTDVPNHLARAVPQTATFFMTYVLTSGWASLSCELIQPFPLFCNLFYRFIVRNKNESSYSTWTFPYHTEIPRVLLFGLLGFICSILAPLMLPFLLVYFFLAYLVYRNQILNVYVTEYQSGGLYWPIVHNTTIFSLVLTQVIALGVFGLKESKIAAGFTIPLIICTLFFHEYCRQRFYPIFKNNVAQVFIEMDQQDQKCGRMEEIYTQLRSAYHQPKSISDHQYKAAAPLDHSENRDDDRLQDLEDMKPGKKSTQVRDGSWSESSTPEIEELNVK